MIESVLFSEHNVRNVHDLNKEILETHKLISLTNIGINPLYQTSYYTAFDSLSSQANEESIIIEVDSLFRNAETFIKMYNHHLNYCDSSTLPLLQKRRYQHWNLISSTSQWVV